MAKPKKVTQPEETISSTEQTQQPQAPNLTLQDLVLVAQIIQISSQRGAFRAEELADIGNLYTKLIAFLQATGALQPASTQPEEN